MGFSGAAQELAMPATTLELSILELPLVEDMPSPELSPDDVKALRKEIRDKLKKVNLNQTNADAFIRSLEATHREKISAAIHKDVARASQPEIELDEEKSESRLYELGRCLGLNIKYLRQRNGISQDDAAIAAGMQRSHLNTIESNRTISVPTLTTIMHIAGVFDLHPCILLMPDDARQKAIRDAIEEARLYNTLNKVLCLLSRSSSIPTLKKMANEINAPISSTKNIYTILNRIGVLDKKATQYYSLTPDAALILLPQ